MPNLDAPDWGDPGDGLRRARIGEQAGLEHLGASVYELQPGESMVFHYHVQREELLIVLDGSVTVRTPAGERELGAGDVVGFPRGDQGAHGYGNGSQSPVRVLVISEQTAPNVSIYPDTGRVGIFDAALPRDRRFGALFDLGDAISGYGGGEPTVSPTPSRGSL